MRSEPGEEAIGGGVNIGWDREKKLKREVEVRPLVRREEVEERNGRVKMLIILVVIEGVSLVVKSKTGYRSVTEILVLNCLSNGGRVAVDGRVPVDGRAAVDDSPVGATETPGNNLLSPTGAGVCVIRTLSINRRYSS